MNGLTYYSRIIRRNAKKVRFKVGLSITVVVVLLAILSPLISPYPLEGYGYIPADASKRKLLPPSPDYLFGTDILGRDLLSRVLIGTQTALAQSLCVVFTSLMIGMVVGVLAAYYKSFIEVVLNYFVELFMSVPSIIIALFLRLSVGQGLHIVILSLTLTWWAWYARICYVYSKSVVDMDYVILAKLSGLSSFKIIPRHVIRNVVQPMFVQAISDLGSALLEASAINFMGLGLPPGSPEWGVIIYEGIFNLGIELFTKAPWLGIFPGVFLLLTTLGFSLTADPLREDLDPRLRRRWRLWF